MIVKRGEKEKTLNFTIHTEINATATSAPNLPHVFKQIYYHLYSNSNIPRAERLAADMIRLIFCKIYDEIHRKGEFFAGSGEGDKEVAARIRNLFEKVKVAYRDVFERDEKIYLDDKSVRFVVLRMQDFALTLAERDVVAEAFQAFYGPALRGEKGQFFTPRNVVRMCVEILSLRRGERIIDPACGSGGFLIEALSHNHKVSVYGIDKEVDLVKICKAYMAILGEKHENIFCADSLDPESWHEEMKKEVRDGSFDVVLTNPPFGARIFIEDTRILKKYKLGHRWKKRRDGEWKVTNEITKQVPQVLFIERCLQLLKEGGRMAIILPDGIFGNPSDRYIWQFIRENARIIAIISLPPETFLPSTHTKTSVLFLEKKRKNERKSEGRSEGKSEGKSEGAEKEGDEDYEIFMAIANKVGHDKNGKIIFKMDERGNYILDERGNRIIDDELPQIVSRFREYYMQGRLKEQNRLGFTVKLSEMRDNIFIPNYYDPETKQILTEMERTGKYKLVTIGELVKKRIISIKRGHEVGSKYYGLGDVPFVRTSDIVNWEIKIDPVKSIPEEIYEKYRKMQDIRENDILLVTDGTFLIGRTAIVTELDRKIVIQSHIRRIRCLKPEKLHPYLLLYLLNTEIVQRQIKEKTFVQATISTVGDRLYEIVLPVPTDKDVVRKIIEEVAEIIRMKVEARKRMEHLIRDGRIKREEESENR